MWPEDVSGDTYRGVERVIVDWDLGMYASDSDFDESKCGTAVSDFTSADVLSLLNAGDDTWVMGASHPVHSWYTDGQLGDYTEVDAALDRVSALDPSDYSNWSIVEDAVDRMVRGLPQSEQDRIDEMARDINAAIEMLEVAFAPADTSELESLIAYVETLDPGDYANFSEVEAILVEAKAFLTTQPDATRQDVVDGYVVSLEAAIDDLVMTSPPWIWDDDDEYVPPIVPVQPEQDSNDDDTTTIVACAAAAVVAALMAVFLIIERRKG